MKYVMYVENKKNIKVGDYLMISTFNSVRYHTYKITATSKQSGWFKFGLDRVYGTNSLNISGNTSVTFSIALV